MKITLKIWLLAILYQTIIFSFLIIEIREEIIILIPIELIGGLPGLLLFGALVNYLIRSHISIQLKWVVIIVGAFMSAYITTSLTGLVLGIPLSNTFFGEGFHLISPAPIAALLSLFSFTLPVHRLLNENLLQRSDIIELPESNN